MKTLGRFGLALACINLIGCAAIVEKTIEQNPDIVLNVIKKNPKKFMEVVSEAAKSAQEEARKQEDDNERARLEDEMKNPKKPSIDEDRTIFGNKEAKITIVEYSDFECPYCSKGYDNLKEVRKQYGDKVRVVFKHLPLEFHPMAMPAAKYFEAVAQQSHEMAEKFHDAIFSNQSALKEKKEQFLKDTAKKLGANMTKLMSDLNSEKVKNRIAKDMDEAKEFGFSGTPGFLINGVSLRGAYPPPYFQKIIDRQLGETK
ncbi:MAG: thioredoxin domain-containing protein [Bdellovibrionales bacterium]|nr:thioredoxin domain-containing protein [Bdellovibrionales bacterium]